MQRYRTPFGDTVAWITGGDATEGAYCVLDRDAPPGARSPGHIHHAAAEAFYVIEGTFEFEIDGDTRTCGPGDFVRAAAGVRHGWRVVGDAPGRALLFFTPSIDERYFSGLDALVERGGDYGKELLALAEEHGLA
jgi:quercetin dioxygenase-like cupin family protein